METSSHCRERPLLLAGDGADEATLATFATVGPTSLG
jgi:hypothetical protein